jgi:hypothetical protein
MGGGTVRLVYFITHPDVVIDPEVPVPQWHLSQRGRERMKKLLAQPWVEGIGAVYCSTEQKAIDGAEILAAHLSIGYEMVEELGEIDRSATGYLPRGGSMRLHESSSLPIQSGAYEGGRRRGMHSGALWRR